MLILAGLTINLVFSDNGIFKTAEESKVKQKEAEYLEQIKIATANARINANGTIDTAVLESSLNNIEGASITREGTGESLPWKVTTSEGYQFEIKENGTVASLGGGSGTGGNGGTTNPPTTLTAANKGEKVIGTNKPYTDETSTNPAIIPVGFCVVKDSIENPSDTNTIARGLVISDKANDTLDNADGETKGNQFVWIPVDDYSKFHLIEGYYCGELDEMLSDDPTASREAGDKTTAGSPGLPYAANSTAGSTESITMYKSVKDNKGFYIARFEAGIAGTTDNYDLSEEDQKIPDGISVKPLSQKGVGVWNDIPWGGTSEDTSETDGLPGNDKANGAVKVARSMYTKSATCGVTSTLCYGVQWDAALNFIDSAYESHSVANDSYVKTAVKDGITRGNYSGDITTTGNSLNYQQNHIYDMAGNAYEWTMEAYNTYARINRGGYSDDGADIPASLRSVGFPEDTVDWIGFRLALYL